MNQPRTIAQALALARTLGVDRLDAQLIVGQQLQRDRGWVLAHDDEALPTDCTADLIDGLHRRAQGEPLAYLLGHKEFHGLNLHVNPAVLVPRPDTETLVDWALMLIDGALKALTAPRVLDLGTGSGAIALAVKAARPAVSMLATDISEPALAVARDNAQHLRLALETRAGSWWAAVPGETFDLVLSNPPYIAEGDIHLAALGHEPRLALTSGADGLNALREIIDGAAEHLAADGWLLVEHGYDQAPAVAGLLAAQGFDAIQHRHDLGGNNRCTGACLRKNSRHPETACG